jgi:putative transposase
MVHRIMHDAGVNAARVAAYRRTTVQDPAARTAHMRTWCLDASGQRSFVSAAPGMTCVGAITYLRTREGWLHLAVVIDLATRAVVGWSLQEHPRTRLVIDALAMARTHGQVRPGTIFHSDRGTHYTSAAFQTWCHGQGITQSMGRTGVCWDNAVAESFFATLKHDLLPHTSFATRAEARRAVVASIEGWYNRRRPHQHHAGMPPMVALERWPTSSLHTEETNPSPIMPVSVS